MAQWLHSGPGPSRGKAVSAIAMSPLARFSQSACPCLFPACAFKPKQPKSVLLLKRLRIFQDTAPWMGHVGMPGPWLKSSSEFITWSAAKESSILMGGLWPWILGAHCLEVLFSLLSYLLAFTTAGWPAFLNLPCSFSPLSLYKKMCHLSFSHALLDLFPSKISLDPKDLWTLFSFSTTYVSTTWFSWLWASRPVSLSISPTEKWPAWPQGLCGLLMAVTRGPGWGSGQIKKKKSTNEWMKTMNI